MPPCVAGLDAATGMEDLPPRSERLFSDLDHQEAPRRPLAAILRDPVQVACRQEREVLSRYPNRVCNDGIEGDTEMVDAVMSAARNREGVPDPIYEMSTLLNYSVEDVRKGMRERLNVCAREQGPSERQWEQPSGKRLGTAPCRKTGRWISQRFPALGWPREGA